MRCSAYADSSKNPPNARTLSARESTRSSAISPPSVRILPPLSKTVCPPHGQMLFDSPASLQARLQPARHLPARRCDTLAHLAPCATHQAPTVVTITPQLVPTACANLCRRTPSLHHRPRPTHPHVSPKRATCANRPTISPVHAPSATPRARTPTQNKIVCPGAQYQHAAKKCRLRCGSPKNRRNSASSTESVPQNPRTTIQHATPLCVIGATSASPNTHATSPSASTIRPTRVIDHMHDLGKDTDTGPTPPPMPRPEPPPISPNPTTTT